MRIHGFLAATAVAGLLDAQSPEPRSATAAVHDRLLAGVVPIHTAPADPDGGAYGVWAAGPGYKVSFHDGFVFHPHAGAGAPTPVRWRLRSVRIGGEELFAPTRAPDLRWTADRCEYDHGRFVEAYDVRSDGVEQTFVLRELPPARGALIVDGEFVTALGAVDAEWSAGELALRDGAGRPRVYYGAATAVDGRGDRRALRSSCRGGRVRLELDGQWLATAALPVVVDPLVRPNLALGLVPRVVSVDIHRDDQESDHNLWVAIGVETAAGDRDLLLKRCNEDFTDAIDVFADITTSWQADDGHLAGVGGTQKLVAAFTRDFGFTRGVRWHARDLGDFAFGGAVGLVPKNTDEHDWRPDAGGTRAFSTSHQALLVWQRDAGASPQQVTARRVRAAFIDTTVQGAGDLGPVLEIDPRALDQDSPAVTPEAEGGQSFSWLVAWRAREPIGISTTLRAEAVRIDNLGNRASTRFEAPLGFPIQSHGPPQIAGRAGRYLLAHTTRGDTELDCMRIDWPHGAASGTRVHDVAPLEVQNGLDLEVDAIAFDTNTRAHWVVVRHDRNSGTLRAFKVGFRGRTVESADVALAAGAVAVAGSVGFDDDSDRFPIAAGVQQPGAALEGRVVFDAMVYEPLAAPATSGTACGPGRLLWLGSQQLGDEFTQLVLLQATPARLALVALSLAPAQHDLTPFGIPGCFLLVDSVGPGAIGIATGTTNGFGRIDLRMPLAEGLSPCVLHAQAFVLDPAANAAGVTGTAALVVPLGR